MMITILSLFSNTVGGTATHKHPVYPTSSLMTTEGAREDNGDVTEQGPRTTGQDTSQAIPRHEELGECSSQVDNDTTTIVTRHTSATLLREEPPSARLF